MSQQVPQWTKVAVILSKNDLRAEIVFLQALKQVILCYIANTSSVLYCKWVVVQWWGRGISYHAHKWSFSKAPKEES